MKHAIALTVMLVASPAAASVQQLIANETTRQIGAQWVPTALKIAKLESGFRCNATGPKTRYGRAKGVFQVMPGTARAMGYNPARLHECNYGISAGLAHMKMCIRYGVKTHAQMASCHVSGWGSFNRRLNKRAETYRNKYIRMAQR